MEQRIEALSRSWQRELEPLVGQIPEFAIVRTRVLSAFSDLSAGGVG